MILGDSRWLHLTVVPWKPCHQEAKDSIFPAEITQRNWVKYSTHARRELGLDLRAMRTTETTRA